MRIYALSLTIAAFIALSGCNNDKMNTEISYNLSSIVDAKKIADPWEAYKVIDARHDIASAERGKFCDDLYTFLTTNGTSCEFNASWHALGEEGDRYLLLAASQINPKALSILFARVNDGKSKKIEVAPKIIQAAESSSNPELLLLAGRILGDGEFAVRDTGRSIEFLARSWALGNTEAAFEASKQFKAINDIRNGYLWSLRCTAGCNRNYPYTLEMFEQHLSPEAAKQVQKAAGDPTIIDLDTNI